jgi:hypothetical protein
VEITLVVDVVPKYREVVCTGSKSQERNSHYGYSKTFSVTLIAKGNES